jgi:hypothetical protein
MSTIKSSAEHLTLNADGASKDIKFQANGVEKASISSAGVMTATSFAGSGAALTGVGVAGISSSADATAMTITSAEKIGIGTGSPSVNVHIVDDASEGTPTFAGATHFAVQATASSGDNVNASLISGSAGVSRLMFGDKDDEDEGKIEYSNSTNAMAFTANGSERMSITSDGRGVSKFTAHAWGKISCQGTPSLLTGHNVSSITDQATGRYKANYTSNSAGSNCVVISGQNNNYYDEIYYVDVDDSSGSRASFGCSRSGTGAGWFDTYKMTFVTFTV